MNTLKACGILIAVALVASNASAQTPAPELAKVRDAYIAATHAGDARAIAGLYTEDGIELPPNQAMEKGRAGIEKFYVGQFKGNAVKLSITPIEAMTAGDIGYDVGTYSQTITPKAAGTKPMTDRGKYVVVLRRGADKQWRVKYAIYNSDLPLQPMPSQPK